MSSERKQVTIRYRKFDRDAARANLSLEAMIRNAMNTIEDDVRICDRYALRVMPSQDENYFVNTFIDQSEGNTLLFGDVIHFTKSHFQALFKIGDKNAATALVEQMPAPAQSEYVHSQMFWMIKGDHVFVIQSRSLRTELFEKYLKWLLHIKTQSLPENGEIVLSAKFDESAIGASLGDIQEIIIGGVAHPPANAIDQTTTEMTEVTQHTKVDVPQTPVCWQILETLLGNKANVESLRKSVPEDAKISVMVHIGYKTKKRETSRVFLHQLETGLRNLPDSQLQVKAKDATKAFDGSIRLHHTASVQLIKASDGKKKILGGSLLDPKDVLRAMYEAYSVFLANGKISPDDDGYI